MSWYLRCDTGSNPVYSGGVAEGRPQLSFFFLTTTLFFHWPVYETVFHRFRFNSAEQNFTLRSCWEWASFNIGPRQVFQHITKHVCSIFKMVYWRGSFLHERISFHHFSCVLPGVPWFTAPKCFHIGLTSNRKSKFNFLKLLFDVNQKVTKSDHSPVFVMPCVK